MEVVRWTGGRSKLLGDRLNYNPKERQSMTQSTPVSRRHFNAVVGACLAMPLAARAQAFPSKPIRILVPFAAGGPTDLMARAVGKSMSVSMGQPVIVENKPGGGGVIAMGEVARGPADGYTLAFPSILAVTNPALMANYPFDTLRDFAPLTVVGYIPHALVVRPDFPAKDLPALVAMAKANPGSVNYGSSGNGTSAHLGAALFAQRADIKVTHVPYRGAAPAMNDTMAGQTQVMFPSLFTAMPNVKNGKLKALGLAGLKRSPLMPDVPTLKEQGIDNVDVSQWYAFFAPAKTPAPVLEQLNKVLNQILTDKAIGKRLEEHGAEVEVMTLPQMRTFMAAEQVKWKKVVQAAKLKAD